MKYKSRKRKLKVSYIILILIICLLLVSSSYAIWQTILTINGTVTGVLVDDKLKVKIVSPGQSTTRLTTNTSLKKGKKQLFKIVGDTEEGNSVVTNITQVNTAKSGSLKVTFELVLKNVSGGKITDGAVEITKNDPVGVITETTNVAADILSKLQARAGQNVRITADINFKITEKIQPGTFINYKISFISKNQMKHYNYKILFS